MLPDTSSRRLWRLLNFSSPHFPFIFLQLFILTFLHSLFTITLLPFHKIHQHISLLSCKSSLTLSSLIEFSTPRTLGVHKIFLLCLLAQTAPSTEVQVPAITSVMATKEISFIMLPCDCPPLACFFHEQLGVKMCPQFIVVLAAVFQSKFLRSN